MTVVPFLLVIWVGMIFGLFALARRLSRGLEFSALPLPRRLAVLTGLSGFEAEPRVQLLRAILLLTIATLLAPAFFAPMFVETPDPPEERPKIPAHIFAQGQSELERNLRGEIIGVRVVAASEGGSWARACLLPGDLVTEVEGVRIDSLLGSRTVVEWVADPQRGNLVLTRDSLGEVAVLTGSEVCEWSQ